MSDSIKMTLKKIVQIVAFLPILILFQNCGSAFQSKSVELASNGPQGSLQLDSQAPAIAILSPAGGSYVKVQTKLAGTCETGLPVLYYIDDAKNTSTLNCVAGAFEKILPSTLMDGHHTAWVSQTDLAGNKAVQSLQFMVDNNSPLVKILAPLVNANLETSSLVNIRGTCENGLNVQIAGPALSAPLSILCAGSAFQVTAIMSSTAGTAAITASQTDMAGNNGSVSTNVVLKLPTIPTPVVKITSPAVNFLTRNRSLTLQGTCESGLSVQVSGTGITSATQTSCNNGNYQAMIQLTAADGLKNVIVAQTNAQNKTGQDSRSFQLDATAPLVTIQSPAAGTQAITGVSLGGNCESGLNVVISGSGIPAQLSVACASGMFQSNIDFSGGLGVKTVTVTQTDSAGNIGSSNRSFERIAAPPPNGPILYANNCASCHLPLANSTKLGKSAMQINSAILNIAQMKSIVLTSAEVDAIAAALSTTSPTPTPSPTIPTIPLASVRVPASTANLSKETAFQSVPVRRLTRDELQNSLTDVLKVTPSSSLMAILPVDLSDERTNPFDNGSDTQSVSGAVVQSYELFAQQYAEQFAAQTATIRTLAGCTPTGATDTACFRKFATNVGRLLLRRPITSVDLTRYEVLMSYANSASNFYEAPKLLVQAFVQHPEFLYRIEAGSVVTGTSLLALNDYGIAARLSYLVWGSAPDSALMNAAEAGQLRTSTQRVIQAQRMLADARAKRQWRRYHGQWLGYDGITLPANQATDMNNETSALVDQIVFNSTNSWMRIFNFDQTYVTPNLARHYGLGSPTSTAWQTRAGGIFTHGSFLAQGAKFGDTSPTLRGYKIAKRILCYQVGPVPSNVDPDTPPGTPGDCKPTRYNMRTQTSCQGCHALTDNIGFGLENYGANGQFRSAENNLPQCTINGEGTVGTEPFTGAEGLANNIAQNPVAVQCAARQLLRFTLGRATTSADQDTVEALHAQYLKTPQLTSMIQAIVETPAFGYK